MTYTEVVNWLFQQIPNYQNQGGSAYKPGLDRILDLLEKIGDPHEKIKTIHVAGTNGKGSVSHILAAIFQQHGYHTGLFTSPHISDFRERIKIDGKCVSKGFVLDFFNANKSIIDQIAPSFFEITTAMAFEAFAEHKCDIAIIETGLGGRLDSTNVLMPELSIITNIGLDHQHFLGDTLEKIALEKAGIIKPNRPVIIGDVLPKLQSVFGNVATEKKSAIHFSSDRDSKVYKTDLLGSYQQRNIHTVLTAVACLKANWKLTDEKIGQALQNVTTLTNMRGRLQEIGQTPRIIVDAAHNEDGILNLFKEIKDFDYLNLRIIYGASNDKNWKGILKIFPKNAKNYFVQFDSSRSVKESSFEAVASQLGLIFSTFADPSEALTKCKAESNPNDLILICGSFYLMEKLI